jgi:hypothetical protein
MCGLVNDGEHYWCKLALSRVISALGFETLCMCGAGRAE